MHRRWRLLHDSGCLISQANTHSPKDQRYNIQTLNYDSDNMASFARSIKSPYLSPRMRPSMSGRTMSTSSDRSNNNSPNSPRSDDLGDFDLSGRNTPTIPHHSRPSRGRDGFFDGEDIGSRTSYFTGKVVRISWNAYPSLIPRCLSLPTLSPFLLIFHYLLSSEGPQSVCGQTSGLAPGRQSRAKADIAALRWTRQLAPPKNLRSETRSLRRL